MEIADVPVSATENLTWCAELRKGYAGAECAAMGDDLIRNPGGKTDRDIRQNAGRAIKRPPTPI